MVSGLRNPHVRRIGGPPVCAIPEEDVSTVNRHEWVTEKERDAYLSFEQAVPGSGGIDRIDGGSRGGYGHSAAG
jgi:hypothetical protein